MLLIKQTLTSKIIVIINDKVKSQVLLKKPFLKKQTLFCFGDFFFLLFFNKGRRGKGKKREWIFPAGGKVGGGGGAWEGDVEK